MKTADAAKSIIALLEEGWRRGAPAASEELRTFLSELAESPGLKKPARSTTRRSPRAAPRVGTRVERPIGADMAKTIEELARKLRDAFDSDDRFESVLNDPTTQKLSRANVVTLYNRVFDTPRPLAKSMTKPDVFNAIRRERINWVRGRS